MKRYCYILFSFLLWCNRSLYGQSGTVDSLKQVLKNNHLHDTDRISTLLQLGWDLSFENTALARNYLYQAIALGEKIKNEIGIGSGYSYVGASYFNQDNFDSAMIFYKEAEKHFLMDSTAEAKESVLVNQMSMGTVALQQGFHETALDYYFKVVDYIMKDAASTDWKNLLTAYANIGLVFNDLKQFDKALEYHTKAIQISDKHREALKMHMQVQDFIALDLLNLKKYDEVIPAIDNAEKTAQQIDSDYFYAMIYALKARYFNEISQYNQSILISEKALRHARAANQIFQKANIYYQLGISYFNLKIYEISQKYFLDALAINRKLKDKVREKATLDYLGKTYAANKHYREASHYFQQYIQLSDSLSQSATQKRINELENKYQSEQKQFQIASLKRDNEFQKSALKQRRIINIALATVSGLLFLIAGLSYFNFKNKNRLFKQAELLQQQKINEIERERKLATVQSVIKGQEVERSRLARDLHDGVGGLLSGIKLSLSTMKGNVFLSEENVQAVNNIIGQLDQSIAELRLVSHNMMPETLIKYGLKETLENYCENINLNGKLKVQLQTYGMENRMEINTEIVLYRIVQELLNNVVKHAKAQHVLVQLAREGPNFTLTVEDDGAGFDVHQVKSIEGAGLENIKARAAYLNGSVDVHSAPGEGTSITVEGICS